jgi:hypothetical protein
MTLTQIVDQADQHAAGVPAEIVACGGGFVMRPQRQLARGREIRVEEADRDQLLRQQRRALIAGLPAEHRRPSRGRERLRFGLHHLAHQAERHQHPGLQRVVVARIKLGGAPDQLPAGSVTSQVPPPRRRDEQPTAEVDVAS